MTNWNSADKPIDLYLYTESQNTIGMVNSDRYEAGYVRWIATTDGVLLRVEIYGNYYWENYYQYTDNQRRFVATHEIGHLIGIGHILESYLPPFLMLDTVNPDYMEMYYVPQIPDIALVNQVYP